MPAKKKNGKVSPAKRLKLAEKEAATLDKAMAKHDKLGDRLAAKYAKAQARVQKLKDAQPSA